MNCNRSIVKTDRPCARECGSSSSSSSSSVDVGRGGSSSGVCACE